MEPVVTELAAVLAGRGPDGELIYSDRDVSVAIALLLALEGSQPGPTTQQHFAEVCRAAGVAPGDPAPLARVKIDRALKAMPLHPALLRQLQRVLRRVIHSFASKESARAVGTAWSANAPRSKDLDTSRGAVLAFRLEQGRTRK